MKNAKKTFDLKVAAQGAEVTPEILAKVNKFALRELTADEIFVRKYLMAHNAVDRDNERFSEALLDDFTKTFPGKSFMVSHDRTTLAKGLFFNSLTEEMTPDQFTALTGEKARLPNGRPIVKVVWGWIYMLKAQFNEELISNIDAGIYRHASIGFRANDIAPVKGQFDQILYWEYSPPGEALEGSIVWLGAQPGATAQKAATVTKTTPNKLKNWEDLDNPLIPAETKAWMKEEEAKSARRQREKDFLTPDEGDEQSTNKVFYRFLY